MSGLWKKVVPGRMPSADASHLAETFVRLARQLLGVPTGGDALEAVSLGDSNRVDHLVLGEHLQHNYIFESMLISSYRIDRDLLLEVLLRPVDFLRHGAAVHLDFHDVGLLLATVQDFHLKFREIGKCFLSKELKKTYLSVSEHPDGGAVLLHLVEVRLDHLLSVLVLPLLRVLRERLLLGLAPSNHPLHSLLTLCQKGKKTSIGRNRFDGNMKNSPEFSAHIHVQSTTNVLYRGNTHCSLWKSEGLIIRLTPDN